MPHRVRCSPLGREEHVADVVASRRDVIHGLGVVEWLTVEIGGHRYVVDAADTTPA